jgi:hypothetical protein
MFVICYLIHVGLLLDLFFYLEDEGDISPETSVDLQWSTRLYIPDDRILQETDKTQQMIIPDGNLNLRSQRLIGPRQYVIYCMAI